MMSFLLMLALEASALVPGWLKANGFRVLRPAYASYHFFQGGDDWVGRCAVGKHQSPIDIVESPVNTLHYQIVTSKNSTFRPYTVVPPLISEKTRFPDQRFEGETVMMLVSSTGKISTEVNGFRVEREIVTALLGVPGAHTVNGVRYPLAISLPTVLLLPTKYLYYTLYVHIRFEEGEANPFIEGIIRGGDLDTSALFPESKSIDDYFYYYGSFDTPRGNCNENVDVIVPNYVMQASEEQIRILNMRYAGNSTFAGGRGNNRNIQPLNDRTVYHYIGE